MRSAFLTTCLAVVGAFSALNAVAASTSYDVIPGNTFAVRTAAPPYGHGIDVRSTCGGSLTDTTFTTAPIVADCAVTITFAQIHKTVTPSAGTHGTIDPSTPVNVALGENVQFTLTGEPGYESFVTSNCGPVETIAYTAQTYEKAVRIRALTTDCSVSATFALFHYPVQTTAGSNGVITPANPVVTHGDTAMLTITPDPGYMIDTVWSTCPGIVGAQVLSVAAITYKTDPLLAQCWFGATFIRYHHVTANGGPNGTIAPDTPRLVPAGSGTQFLVTHAPGFHIGDTQGTCTFSWEGPLLKVTDVNADCTVNVEFLFNATWRPAGTMRSARIDHTATLLLTGKVLVAGGNPDDAAAELYDPADDSWTTTGALASKRTLHTATRLPSGKVLVVGGVLPNGIRLAGVELYDPMIGLWTPRANLNVARTNHTATLLPSGKVLVTGGFTDGPYLRSVELYDPEEDRWTLLQPMLSSRANHGAALISDRELLVAGSVAFNSPETSEILDLDTLTWRPGPDMAVSRTQFSLERLASGKIIAASGNLEHECNASVQAFDPVTGAWTDAGALNFPSVRHVTTALPDGRALVTGGYLCNQTFTGRTEVYFPLSNAWVAIGRLSDERRGHTVTVLANGKVLVAGGSSPYIAQVAEKYDPTVAVVKCHLDVDGNGRQDALTDGMLLMRYMSGLRGAALIEGVVGLNATRTDAGAIEAFIAAQDLDIDSNRSSEPLTDGLLILRYLFGATGSELAGKTLGDGATLTQPAKIVARLNGGCSD